MLDDPLIGRQLANFQIERTLGRGGMAQVYYGQDIKLQRPVAIKVIDARYRGNPAYAQRFVREAQAIARWRHEHIIQIHYADDQDGLYYFVMEYIDGQDLGQLIAQYGTQNELIPQLEVLRIGRAIASALDYAHQRGVIHRDVKPSNVLIAHDGRVVLADFGLAMDTEQGSMGEVFGSAHYVAPEQARHSAHAVPPSDLYSLGIILYEMLTGQVPFDDPSSTAVAIQHLTQPPPPPRELNPKLNEATEAVLLKALDKSPGQRYQSGAALMDALDKALSMDPSALVEEVEPPPTLPELLLTPEAVPERSLAATPPSFAEGSVLNESEERVLNAGEEPALSINEGPAKTQRMTGPPPAIASAATRNRPVYLGAGVGLILILVTGCLVLSVTFWWLRSPNQNRVAENASQASSTAPPVLSPTDTLIAGTGDNSSLVTETPSSIAVPPAEPSPPASPAGYDFLIAKRGEDSLFVVNLSPTSLPLAPLRLGNDKGSIKGTDWGVPTLENGACVAAWKSEGKPSRPEVSCSEVGQSLSFRGKDRFWGETIEVYYGEQLIGVCPKDQETCTFNTASTFSPPVENNNEGGDENNEKKDKKD